MEETQPLHNKYTTVSRFLLAMECLLFILRPVQILVWCKLWELDFGEVGGGNTYANLAPPAVPAAPPVGQQAQFAGGGTHHVGGGGAGNGNGYRPFIVPEASAAQQQQQQPMGINSYVPPQSPPLGKGQQQNEYGE